MAGSSYSKLSDYQKAVKPGMAQHGGGLGISESGGLDLRPKSVMGRYDAWRATG